MSIGVKVAVIVAVVIIIIVAGCYCFMQLFEVTTERVYVGYKGEVRHNPYLAAERLLKNRGFKIEYIHNEHQIAMLPSTESTIYFLISRDTFNKDNLEKLLNWVESGGNLILDFRYEYFSDENFLSRDFFINYLGIEIEENLKLDDTDIVNNFDTGLEADNNTDFNVILPEINEKLAVTLDKSFIFNDINKRAYWAIDEGENTFFLQFRIKQGYISVMGSLLFMENQWIGENNNARFFWYLTTQGYQKDEVWFIMRHEIPAFMTILLSHSWMLWISVCIFLVFFVWKSSKRFGPVIIVSESVRRSLLEHVYACGHFLWSRGEKSELLEAFKQVLKRKIKAKLLKWDTLAPDKQLDIMRQRTGLNRDILNELFISHKSKELSRNQFLQKLILLERINKKI